MNVTFDRHHFRPQQFVKALTKATAEELPNVYEDALDAAAAITANRPNGFIPTDWIDSLYYYRKAQVDGPARLITPPAARWLAAAAAPVDADYNARTTLWLAHATTFDGDPVVATTDGLRLHILTYAAEPGLYVINARTGTIHPYNNGTPDLPRFPNWQCIVPARSTLAPASITDAVVTDTGIPAYLLSSGHLVNRKYIDQATLKPYPTAILAPPSPLRPIRIHAGPHFAVLMPLDPARNPCSK